MILSEEEKKAIERCNELIKDEHKEWIGMSNQEAIKIALNLIGKLQKEKIPTIFYACDPNKYKKCKKYNCYINGGPCDTSTNENNAKYIDLDDYIHKNEIKEIIENNQKKIRKLNKETDGLEILSLIATNNYLKEILEES